ncbi:hypothetical protein [Epilithonimonas sp.]|uniref:hypothetical protein n=1 Tax=Epilithonimonas sp. TaxID=2894511 RepID=UPI0028AF58F5|nr:hypothetical protein [Epilithonimonas sp.]
MERNENGTLKKGTVLNPAGRPKGSVNNTTKEIRDFYTDFLNGNKEKIKADFEDLEPKERLKFIIDISKFVIPTLKAVESDIEVKGVFNIPNIPDIGNRKK